MLRRQQDVLRLDVAVNDAALVGVGDRVGDLAQEAQCGDHRVAIAALETAPERLPLDVRHDVVQQPLPNPSPEDGEDVRVLQVRRHVHFALEPSRRLRTHHVRRQHLDHDRTAKRRGVGGQHQSAHPPGWELALDDIRVPQSVLKRCYDIVHGVRRRGGAGDAPWKDLKDTTREGAAKERRPRAYRSARGRRRRGDTFAAMNSPSRWSHYQTVVLLCFAAVFISYLDRTNISVASIAMQEQFGWTETTKGIVLSSFFAGYLVLQVASGTLANRFGGKIVLGTAVVWWSLFTVLTPPAAIVSLPMLIAARIALGLGEAAVFPASINMVGRWVPEGQTIACGRALLQRTLDRDGLLAPHHRLAGARVRLARPVLRVRRAGTGVGRRLVLVRARGERLGGGDGDDARAPGDSLESPPSQLRGLGDHRQSFLQQLVAVRPARLAPVLLQVHLRGFARQRGIAVGRPLALQLRDGQRRRRARRRDAAKAGPARPSCGR